jgi:hypothetical protein
VPSLGALLPLLAVCTQSDSLTAMDEWVRQAHVWASQAESWAHQQPSEQVYIATAVVAVTILVLIPASYLKSLAPL